MLDDAYRIDDLEQDAATAEFVDGLRSLAASMAEDYEGSRFVNGFLHQAADMLERLLERADMLHGVIEEVIANDYTVLDPLRQALQGERKWTDLKEGLDAVETVFPFLRHGLEESRKLGGPPEPAPVGDTEADRAARSHGARARGGDDCKAYAARLGMSYPRWKNAEKWGRVSKDMNRRLVADNPGLTEEFLKSGDVRGLGDETRVDLELSRLRRPPKNPFEEARQAPPDPQAP